MGIDVSKNKNAYCIIADGECLETGELPNTRKGIGDTVKKAKKYGARVVFEPTGGYERLLKKKLLAAGVPCSMPDAGRIRLYARKSKSYILKLLLFLSCFEIFSHLFNTCIALTYS